MIHFWLALWVTFGVLFRNAESHGRLTIPTPRDEAYNLSAERQGKPITYESTSSAYDEAGFSGGANDPVFICRNLDATNPSTTIEAGTTLPVKWEFSAFHPGDCAFYLSYDYNLEPNEMRWFKIANFEACDEIRFNDNSIQIPDWTPAGRAVLRWEWYATHVYPRIEFYVQCADINVINNNNVEIPRDLFVYTLINPRVFPESAEENSEAYWNEASTETRFVTGPPCGANLDTNHCFLTAAGTKGSLDISSRSTQFSDIHHLYTTTISTTTLTPSNPGACFGFTLDSCKLIENDVQGMVFQSALNCQSSCDLLLECKSWKWEANQYAEGAKICHFCSNANPNLVEKIGETSGKKNSEICPGFNNGDAGNQGTLPAISTLILIQLLFLFQ